MQKFTIHEIKRKTNIKYFQTEFYRTKKDYIEYIEIYHPIYNNITITENKYLIISNTNDQYPWTNKHIIDLTESDWIDNVNQTIPYNLKDIINGFSKLPSNWACTAQDNYSKKIKPEAIEGALKVADIIEKSNLPLPDIYPICFGTIIFDWDNCEIEIFSNNALEFYYEFEGENENPINFVIAGQK